MYFVFHFVVYWLARKGVKRHMRKWLICFLAALALMQTGCASTNPPSDKKPEHVYLCFGGYNAPVTIDLTVQANGVDAIVQLGTYEKKGQLPLQAKEQLQALFSQYSIEKWDGFRGYNDMMLDGEQFDFSAEMSDQTTVSASGSNHFPNHYSDVKAALMDLVQPILDEE